MLRFHYNKNVSPAPLVLVLTLNVNVQVNIYYLVPNYQINNIKKKNTGQSPFFQTSAVFPPPESAVPPSLPFLTEAWRGGQGGWFMGRFDIPCF